MTKRTKTDTYRAAVEWDGRYWVAVPEPVV